MRIFPTFQLHSVLKPVLTRTSSSLFSLLLGLMLWSSGAGFINRANAETPETAPANVKTLLSEVDAAANRQDIKAVMQFYGQNFTNSDGVTYPRLQEVLTKFWETYSNLNYSTKLQSWKQDGNAIVTTTVTDITGTKTIHSREFTLNSTITSQQRIENQKIVQQEILTENNKLTLGNQPPTVQFNLPEQVKVGQEFSLDAIVKEPLGDEILVGTAIVQPTSEKAYFDEGLLQLEFLPSGGVFKVGQAPTTADDQWVTAILMRQGGVTLVTKRLRVVEQ